VSRQNAARGFSLPELMVSLTLGLLLLAAFIAVLQLCRREFAASESLAGLQDSARQAMSVIVPDLEHAGFFGFTNSPQVRFTQGGRVVADGIALRQPDAQHAIAPVPALPSGAHDCGVNFAIDLALPVQGTDNSFAAGVDARDCAPTAAAGGAREGADTVTVRHASRAPSRPLAGRLQLYSRRLEAHGAAELFADGRAPGPMDSEAEVRDLEVRSYYIANDSVDRRRWPALRVKALTEARGAAQFRDEEILTGVEDLQVEFGVRDPGDAQARLSFVAPDITTLRDRRVVAVRLWLRIRADRTESGYFDARPLRYAGVEFTPTPAEARQRRLLVQRTVNLRNLRIP
jgi:type IV pilus assembly protein PilW